jgi:hypothetical protein
MVCNRIVHSLRNVVPVGNLLKRMTPPVSRADLLVLNEWVRSIGTETIAYLNGDRAAPRTA